MHQKPAKCHWNGKASLDILVASLIRTVFYYSLLLNVCGFLPLKFFLLVVRGERGMDLFYCFKSCWLCRSSKQSNRDISFQEEQSGLINSFSSTSLKLRSDLGNLVYFCGEATWFELRKLPGWIQKNIRNIGTYVRILHSGHLVENIYWSGFR